MRKIIIIVGIVLIVLAIILLVLTKTNFVSQKTQNGLSGIFSQQNSNGNNGLIQDNSENKDTIIEQKQLDPIDELKAQLESKSKSFLEFYYSYSSDNPNHWKGLSGMMSDNMQSQAQNEFINIPSEGFYGVTTKIIAISLKEFDQNDLARFEVSLRQEETKNQETNFLNKTGEIVLINQSENWKIDRVILDK